MNMKLKPVNQAPFKKNQDKLMAKIMQEKAFQELS